MLSLLSSSPTRWALPVAVFCFLFGTFAAADKILAKDLKEKLSDFLLSNKSFDALDRLPSVSKGAFESFFGIKHLSWRCVKTSIAISVFSILSLSLFSFLYNPKMVTGFIKSVSLAYGRWVHNLLLNPKTYSIGERLAHFGVSSVLIFIFMFWVFWSFLPDYLSLLKSRIIIVLFNNSSPSLTGLLITLISDFFVSIVVFFVSAAAFQALIIVVFVSPDLKVSSFDAGFWLILGFAPIIFTLEIAFFLVNGLVFFSVPFANLFWASMVPSIWLWAYIISALGANILVRNRTALRLISKFFDVQNSPFSFLGFLSGGIGGLVTVVFLALGTIIQLVS
jgi:hypothetical protein